MNCCIAPELRLVTVVTGMVREDAIKDVVESTVVALGASQLLEGS